jgi:hypothetical protein
MAAYAYRELIVRRAPAKDFRHLGVPAERVRCEDFGVR